MIHPTAIIDSSATIHESVEIGAYTVIGADVEIAEGSTVGPHVVINGPTKIGKNNKIFQFASLGEVPQDLKYFGEPAPLIIGDNNTIREFTTFNRGTDAGSGKTVIGNHNLLMAYVHIAHDCVVGNHVIFSNGTSLAGHAIVGDHVILSGFTLVHQFTKIGDYAFTGMGTALNRDLPPYVLATGNYARAIGINKEGLKRKGFDEKTISAISSAFKSMVKNRNRQKGMDLIKDLIDEFPEVAKLAEFVMNSERGVVR